jgi:uncharacterized 2Fe-2S/4Fe-4S cluster protein (DUF4445 family)
MAEHQVSFEGISQSSQVTTGTLVVEAAQGLGLTINQPCGGQGRCGRCVVRVLDGSVRQRSTLRLSQESIADGYVLACQAVIEGNVRIEIPPQEKFERHLTTDRMAIEIQMPTDYDYHQSQTVQRIPLRLSPPSMDDQTDDWSRLLRTLRQHNGYESVTISLEQLRSLGGILRQSNWQITLVLDTDTTHNPMRVIDMLPDHVGNDEPLWGAAIDIGTTTVTVWLVNLITGEVKAQVAEYNGQIACGEDVISRIIYSNSNHGRDELRQLVLETVNQLLDTACKRVQAQQQNIMKATIAGNSIMMHLLLGIPAESIRLAPFVTAINHVPLMLAKTLGLDIHPEASVDCLPGIASYVGADITAGVLSSGQDDTDEIALFIDVGTNGEMVLGNRDWLAACACSAGPAFEGAGVGDGMRATKGAVEEVWINGSSYEPTYRVIGGVKARGICGSGLISLLAEMFLTGIIDKAGHINTNVITNRVRIGAHGSEYVLVWKDESSTGHDIVISNVDIDNLLRAKAAIYAGFTVLSEKVGVPLELVEKVMIGGAFGKYINVEKAVEIGLLPDKAWDQFNFLGNTAIKGSYQALLEKAARQRIRDIASRMTYIELSADNSFYEAFTSALFLPHTDMSRFPTVQAEMENLQIELP